MPLDKHTHAYLWSAGVLFVILLFIAALILLITALSMRRRPASQPRQQTQTRGPTHTLLVTSSLHRNSSGAATS